MKPDIWVFCDGACSGNPGPGGWGTVILWRKKRIEEYGGRQDPTTNNQMELKSLLMGLRRLKGESAPILILMDSVYVLKGATEWWRGWKAKGWKTSSGEPVANRDLWELLIVELGNFKKNQLQFGHVKGHANIAGNERADKIAVAFSQGNHPNLENGEWRDSHSRYFDIPEKIDIPELQWNRGEKKSAYSYLSYVNGLAMRHSNWAECEAKVKGRAGAKFKKAMTAEDEISILASWGVDPDKIR